MVSDLIIIIITLLGAVGFMIKASFHSMYNNSYLYFCQMGVLEVSNLEDIFETWKDVLLKGCI